MAPVGADGDPMISYPDVTNSDLKLAICDISESANGNCDQADDWNTLTVETAAHSTSMAVDASGNPMISYHYLTDQDLKFAFCDLSQSANGNCDQPDDWSLVIVDSEAGYVGDNTSLAVDDNGNPMISYFDEVNTAVKFAMCDMSASLNGNCDQTADWSTETVDASEEVGYYTSIAVGDTGNPMISYNGGPNRDLKFATLPPPDTDGDGFPDHVEVYLATDPADACPDDPTDDAWPLDMDMNTLVNLGGDVVSYIGKIGCNVSTNPECQRLDLDRNGLINLGGDVATYIGTIGDTCT